MTRAINGFIGFIWSTGGFFLMLGGLLLFVSVFFADIARALYAGMPIPENASDFIIISSIILLGFFCMSWGSAMLKREEWGALVGGLVRLTVFIYLLAVGIAFWRNGPAWLQRLGPGPTSFYQRYDWLVWSIYVATLAWFFGTTLMLLVSKRRRDFYAMAYQDDPVANPATCQNCGLIQDNGACPECDRPRQKARLVIGDRHELLEFTTDTHESVRTLGRQKNNRKPDVILSDRDAARLERISGEHAQIWYDFESGQFFIQDLDSTNKTYLNGKALPPHMWYPLKAGDTISLAQEVELLFESEDDTP